MWQIPSNTTTTVIHIENKTENTLKPRHPHNWVMQWCRIVTAKPRVCTTVVGSDDAQGERSAYAEAGITIRAIQARGLRYLRQTRDKNKLAIKDLSDNQRV